MPNNTTMLNLAVGYAKVYLHLFVYFVHPLVHIETFYYTSNIVSELSISPNTNIIALVIMKVYVLLSNAMVFCVFSDIVLYPARSCKVMFETTAFCSYFGKLSYTYSMYLSCLFVCTTLVVLYL